MEAKKIKINQNQLIILFAGLLIGGLVGFAASGMAFGGSNAVTGAASFLNENFLNPQGLSADITYVENMDGVVAANMDIMDENGSVLQSTPIYITKSGRYIFPQMINTEVESDNSESSQSEIQDIPKSEKPTVQLYVMSFCPYGSQAEQIMQPVVNLLKNYITIEPKFIVDIDGDEVGSLHGEVEANEDLRQVCIWEHYQNKWWDYVDYVNTQCSFNDIDTCWEAAAESIGIDKEKIETCFEEEAIDLIKEHAELTEKYEIYGSPTLLINEVKYQGSRGVNAFKDAICLAFEDAPEECTEVLEEVGSNPSGSC